MTAEEELWVSASQLAGQEQACGIYSDYLQRFPKGRFHIAARRMVELPPCTDTPKNFAINRMDYKRLALGFGPESPGLDCDSYEATIYFDLDRSSLNSSSVASLDQIIGRKVPCEIQSYVVDGHDDGTFVNEDGTLISDEMSMRASQRRAQAVADYLIANGTPADKILINTFGNSRPAIREGNSAFNRRVELTVIYGDGR